MESFEGNNNDHFHQNGSLFTFTFDTDDDPLHIESKRGIDVSLIQSPKKEDNGIVDGLIDDYQTSGSSIVPSINSTFNHARDKLTDDQCHRHLYGQINIENNSHNSSTNNTDRNDNNQ